MRITIERIRTLVLAAGVLLVTALVVFLAVGKWKNPFNRRDLPQRLGLNIQQEANGWTYTHGQRGHTLYKIHASKVVQLKHGDHVLLHDVRIELYGADGSRVDRIEGNEFEYAPQGGTAKANGTVEITLMRPGAAPAIAPKAVPKPIAGERTGPLASAAEAAERGEIHVKTSGLSFDENSGVATTAERVEFSLEQGVGSSMGATYDSNQGFLVLDRTVELTTRRGAETVNIHAQHAEFERDDQICRLREATAKTRDEEASATDAKIFFHDDGSVERLDATNGFTMSTSSGSRVTAPAGHMDFDEHNQPQHAQLEGGVTMDAASQNGVQSRKMHGTAPRAELEFTSSGELRQTHLERGVEMRSEELSRSARGPLRQSRLWRSPVADLEFRKAAAGQRSNPVELSAIHGTGGVIMTSESQLGNEAVVPSRLEADELTGHFDSASVLTAMTGVGHASLEQTTATGTRQRTSGDRLEAYFAPGAKSGAKSELGSANDIQSATVEGNVQLFELPAARTASSGQVAPAPLRAWAGKAVYEGAGQWLHLTQEPRVEDGALQLTSEKIDVSQESGDAFAHGNVKASWLASAPGKPHPSSAPAQAGQTVRPAIGGGGAEIVALGGQGAAHVVATEAQLQRASNEAIFHGQARLWQQANSIAAPVIVLDRNRQTLEARTTSASEPVRAVLVSAAEVAPGRALEKSTGKNAGLKTAAPAVIRLRGGEFRYSDIERKGIMRGGILGKVVAETGTAESVSSEVELILLPVGNHADGKGGATQGSDQSAAQVDRIIARGHVVVTSQGRRGTGEQLVYTSATGEYVLTGSAAAPPKLTDPARGTVTGETLIFHSRDESVSVEGGTRKTTTVTTAPR